MKQENRKKYSLIPGRFQCIPPHEGHIVLIESILNEGKNVLIAVRDTEINENNPYTLLQRMESLKLTFSHYGDRVKVISIPDITEIVFGRKVGYGIREISLSLELEAISATEIRKKEREENLWK